MKKMKTIALSFLSVIVIVSCSSVTYEKIYPTLKDGKYDSEFPYRSSSEELKFISSTIFRINSTAFYKSYLFDRNDKLTLDSIKNGSIEEMAIKEGYFDQSGSGTGTVIFASRGKVALLTCAHIINYPDTVISYAVGIGGKVTDIVETVLIKDKQYIFAAGFPENSKLEILTLDKNSDLAIVGVDYGSLRVYNFPVFDFPLGRAKDLEWGTFVYVFGFPINYQMITKALVSNPDKDNTGGFLIDAVVNPGYSGGLVLAIRDGIPNFELVGIVQWAPRGETKILVPEKRSSGDVLNTIVPYKGDIYIDNYIDLKYGIARVISIETVIQFFKSNERELINKGYHLDSFFNRRVK